MIYLTAILGFLSLAIMSAILIVCLLISWNAEDIDDWKRKRRDGTNPIKIFIHGIFMLTLALLLLPGVILYEILKNSKFWCDEALALIKATLELPSRWWSALSTRPIKTKSRILESFSYYQSQENRIIVQLVIDDLREDIKELKRAGANPVFIRSVIWWHTLKCIIGICWGGIKNMIWKIVPVGLAANRLGVGRPEENELGGGHDSD